MHRINKKNQRGFTLMEIIVATTIFAMVVAGLTSLLSYTMRINRRSQALRQATQGIRNLVEFMVKEIRNGQIDYAVSGGQTVLNQLSPCPLPSGTLAGQPTNGRNTYNSKENRVAILNKSGQRECVYYADGSQNYVTANTYASPGGTLMVLKDSAAAAEPLLPPNVTVEKLVFFVRPLCDPYTPSCVSYGNSFPRIQPSLFMAGQFLSKLPTGEQVSIYYQTVISTDKYDVPGL